MKLLLPALLVACAPFAPTQSASVARHGASPDILLAGPSLGWGMASGDLNGDGTQDLVATTDDQGIGAIHVWYGQPDATFVEGPVVTTPFPITSRPYFYESTRPVLAVVDLQGDGLDDVVLWGHAWLSGANGLTPIAATFSAKTSRNVGDVDGDGADDLFASVYVPSTSPDYGWVDVRQVAFSNGAFSATTRISYGVDWDDGDPRFLGAPGDLNGDGYADLTVGRTGGGASLSWVGWYAGGPTSIQAPANAEWSEPGTSSSFAAGGHADVNGDGIDDLITLHRGIYGEARLFLSGLGDAIPIPGPASATRWADNALLPGDLDGDGTPDLLIASDIDGRGVVHRLRNVAGAFEQPPDLYWEGETAGARLGMSMVSLGDMDGDGAVEVAIAEPGNNSVLIVRGGPGEGCAPGDVPAMTYDDNDGDGQTSAWSPRATCMDPGEPDGGDCDDDDPLVYQGAPDPGPLQNDADCDGISHCALDADGDTWGSTTIVDSPTFTCAVPGLAARDTDCDDTRSWVHPGPYDVAGDNVDGNCDGVLTCYLDNDSDGYLGYRYTAAAPSCSGAPPDDCNDDAATIHPGAPELPADRLDSDCDGLEVCFRDDDGDRFGDGLFTTHDAWCNRSPAATEGGDCDDSSIDVHPDNWDLPGDGLDADCNGVDTPELTVTIRPDGRLDLQATDLASWGQIAVLVSRTGPGQGPCLPWMAGACSRLRQPAIAWHGVGGFGRNLTLTPPAGLSGTRVAFELWSVTGQHATSSPPVAITLP